MRRRCVSRRKLWAAKELEADGTRRVCGLFPHKAGTHARSAMAARVTVTLDRPARDACRRETGVAANTAFRLPSGTPARPTRAP